MEKYELLSDHQCGFRSNRPTSSAVMELVENISTAIDKKQYAVGVSVDLRKAVDSIDRSLLLHKLERCGIRGVPLNWIRIYLNNRFQFNNTVSHLRKVTCGVPQGSVLGPQLFILYLNYIGSVFNKLNLLHLWMI